MDVFGGYEGMDTVTRYGYVQIMTTGDAIDFGNLLAANQYKVFQMVMEVYNV